MRQMWLHWYFFTEHRTCFYVCHGPCLGSWFGIAKRLLSCMCVCLPSCLPYFPPFFWKWRESQRVGPFQLRPTSFTMPSVGLIVIPASGKALFILPDCFSFHTAHFILNLLALMPLARCIICYVTVHFNHFNRSDTLENTVLGDKRPG